MFEQSPVRTGALKRLNQNVFGSDTEHDDETNEELADQRLAFSTSDD